MYVSPGITPARSPVRPRVVPGGGGEALPLEDVVAGAIAARGERILCIQGRPFDRSAAMSHLAAVLAADADVALLEDQPREWDIAAAEPYKVGVYAGDERFENVTEYHLIDWTRDDWIEYLLATHRDRCRSVMARLSATTDCEAICGIPELGRVVLDEMAADEGLPNPECALERRLERMVDTPVKERDWHGMVQAHVIWHGGRVRKKTTDVVAAHAYLLHKAGCDAATVRLVGHAIVQDVCVAADIARCSREGRRSEFLELELRAEALARAAVRVAGDAPARAYLASLTSGFATHVPPNAASILVAIDRAWRPAAGSSVYLQGARLEGVQWDRMQLTDACLLNANLRRASLVEAVLHRCTFTFADLSGADLTRAQLTDAHAACTVLTRADLTMAVAERAKLACAHLEHARLEAADLTEADLTGAILTGARFRRAKLTGALLTQATVEHADFTGADLQAVRMPGIDLRQAILRAARLAEACLTGAQLDGIDLASVDLTNADLTATHLTDAFMPGARLNGAKLHSALLAGVNWERADLRNADLTRATFHMGTSRSGLVFSPLASEGTRTGFYTDEARDQTFRAPEEFRVANLCHADLRGARIEGVDFYLVDLRGAQLDPEQEVYVRKCGAILGSRV